MAKKQVTKTANAGKAATGTRTGAGTGVPDKEARMPLSKMNYALMLIGLSVIIAGFLLMAGGGSDDPTVFNQKMFSFRRITLAPIVVIAGFAFEIFAIMWRPGSGKKEDGGKQAGSGK